MGSNVFEPGAGRQTGYRGAGPSASLPPLAGADLEDLLSELLLRVDRFMDDQRRLRLLLDGVVAIAADLSLDRVLHRIVETASKLANARYAALGVLGAGPHRRLEAFITHGISLEQRESIGDLPHGLGLLGLIIDRPEPVRLHDIAAHPTSYGFPAEHPEMHSFLGVPVRIRGKVFGNLYLTEQADGEDFTEQDEAIVVALAAAAGVVIENARLYEEGARRERWLAATAEITGLLLGPVDQQAALQTVADRAREITGADIGCVFLRGADHDLVVQVVSADGGLPARGVIPLEGSLVGDVVATGNAVVIDDVRQDPRSAQDLVSFENWPEVGPAVLVPLQTADGIEGALSLVWTPENTATFHAVDVQLPRSFAEQAALAIQVARARTDKEKLAIFEDHDRIGRDLHDLVIQRLFAIGLKLQNTSRLVETPEVARRLSDAVDDIDATIKDIRRSIFAISVDETSPDVRRAVSEVVDRASGTMDLTPSLRFLGPVNAAIDDEIEGHLLSVLAEALSNVSRHAGASKVDVSLEIDDGVTLWVVDDGRGIPPDVARSGLRNMQLRAEQLGGTCRVESEAGSGTTIRWRVPTR